MAKFSLVIPAYNESRTISNLLEVASQFIQAIIVVNDGSNDDTGYLAARQNVTVTSHNQNQGKGAALASGFEKAQKLGTTHVITMDGDGQHDPAEIPRFIEASHKFPDNIIMGARIYDSNQTPIARRCINAIANFFLSWSTGTPLLDSQSAYRLYPIQVLKQIKAPTNSASNFKFDNEVLIEAARLGVNFTFIPIHAIYPKYGRESYGQPIIDIPYIGAMIVKKIIIRGGNPAGLWKTLFQKPKLFF